MLCAKHIEIGSSSLKLFKLKLVTFFFWHTSEENCARSIAIARIRWPTRTIVNQTMHATVN